MTSSTSGSESPIFGPVCKWPMEKARDALTAEERALLAHVGQETAAVTTHRNPISQVSAFLIKRRDQLEPHRESFKAASKEYEVENTRRLKRLVRIDRVVHGVILLISAALLPACFFLPHWAPFGIGLPLLLILHGVRLYLSWRIRKEKALGTAIYYGLNMQKHESIKLANPLGPWTLPAIDRRCRSDKMYRDEVRYTHPEATRIIPQTVEGIDLENASQAKEIAACRLAQIPHPSDHEYAQLRGKFASAKKCQAYDRLNNLYGGLDFFIKVCLPQLEAMHREGHHLYGGNHPKWDLFLQATREVKQSLHSEDPEKIKEHRVKAIAWMLETRTFAREIAQWVVSHPTKFFEIYENKLAGADELIKQLKSDGRTDRYNRASNRIREVRRKLEAMKGGDPTTEACRDFDKNVLEPFLKWCEKNAGKYQSRWKRFKDIWLYRGDFIKYTYYRGLLKDKGKVITELDHPKVTPIAMRRVGKNREDVILLRGIDKKMIRIHRAREYGNHVFAPIVIIALMIIFRNNPWALMGCSSGFLVVPLADAYAARCLRKMHKRKMELKMHSHLRDHATLIGNTRGMRPEFNRHPNDPEFKLKIRLEDLQEAQKKYGLDGVEMTWARAVTRGNRAFEPSRQKLAQEGSKIVDKYINYRRRIGNFIRSDWGIGERNKEAIPEKTSDAKEYEHLAAQVAEIETQFQDVYAEREKALCELRTRIRHKTQLKRIERALKWATQSVIEAGVTENRLKKIETPTEAWRELEIRLGRLKILAGVLATAMEGDQPREAGDDINALCKLVLDDAEPYTTMQRLLKQPVAALKEAQKRTLQQIERYDSLRQQMEKVVDKELAGLLATIKKGVSPQGARQVIAVQGTAAIAKEMHDMIDSDLKLFSERAKKLGKACTAVSKVRTARLKALRTHPLNKKVDENQRSGRERLVAFCKDAPSSDNPDALREWWVNNFSQLFEIIASIESEICDRIERRGSSLASLMEGLGGEEMQKLFFYELLPIRWQLPLPLRRDLQGLTAIPQPVEEQEATPEVEEKTPPSTPATVATPREFSMTPFARRIGRLSHIVKSSLNKTPEQKDNLRPIQEILERTVALRDALVANCQVIYTPCKKGSLEKQQREALLARIEQRAGEMEKNIHVGREYLAELDQVRKRLDFEDEASDAVKIDQEKAKKQAKKSKKK